MAANKRECFLLVDCRAGAPPAEMRRQPIQLPYKAGEDRAFHLPSDSGEVGEVITNRHRAGNAGTSRACLI
jgi:hypothetical protein